MGDPVRILSGIGRVRITDRRSIFIAEAAPVGDEDAALRHLRGIREEFPDATHHVYAYRTRLDGESRTQRHSDDGEPQGTAGLPVLDVLLRNRLDQSLVVVVRYFGGIRLGPGGLVRAYGAAATQAVDMAGIAELVPVRTYRVTISYGAAGLLLRRLEQIGYPVGTVRYGLDVDATAACLPDEAEDFLSQVRDVASGAALVERLEDRLLPVGPGGRPSFGT